MSSACVAGVSRRGQGSVPATQGIHPAPRLETISFFKQIIDGLMSDQAKA